jgi:hypothetical protein
MWPLVPGSLLEGDNCNQLMAHLLSQFLSLKFMYCVIFIFFIYLFLQITTNSKLLSTADIDDLCKCIPIQRQNVTLLTLQSFDTEQQFSRKIRYRRSPSYLSFTFHLL